MEIFVVRIVNPVDRHFIELRIPSGSFETIARWFINDFNSFEIKIVNRYISNSDGSPVGDEVKNDVLSKFGLVANGNKNL